MAIINIGKEDLISAVRGLNIRDLSVRDLEYIIDLFQLKCKQMEVEINLRKREGRD